MKHRNTTQFNCFSPPVMLATLSIESVLALYTVWRYKLNELTRLAIITFVALATFQLSEYFVCTGYGSHAEAWSRLGYLAITTLPPLGLHILHVLTGKPRRRLVATAYASMMGFIGFFLLYHAAFIGHQCTGNYVIFQIGDRMAGLYGTYYYGWLFTALGLGVYWSSQLKRLGKKSAKALQAVRALIIGYLVFLLPTALANTIKPQTRRGIPSIMCGFAVLFAFILAFYVLPRMGQKRITH